MWEVVAVVEALRQDVPACVGIVAEGQLERTVGRLPADPKIASRLRDTGTAREVRRVEAVNGMPAEKPGAVGVPLERKIAAFERHRALPADHRPEAVEGAVEFAIEGCRIVAVEVGAEVRILAIGVVEAADRGALEIGP